MDLRRLEESGDRVGLLRELLRRGLSDEARALVLRMIQGGEPYALVDAEGVARSVSRLRASELKEGALWVRVSGLRVPALWTPQRERLFAVDVATGVLPLFEGRYPEDTRPREAIEVARRYAYGRATGAELQKARLSAKQAADWVGERAGEPVGVRTCPKRVLQAAASAAAAAGEACAVGVWGAVREAVEASTAWAMASVRSSIWEWEWALDQAGIRAPEAFNQATVEPLFLRWSLGGVPKYAGCARPRGQWVKAP